MTAQQIQQTLAKLRLMRNGGDANSLLLLELLNIFQSKMQAVKGDPGNQGDPGPAGKTPQKGVDYFTAAELNNIVMDIVTNVRRTLKVPQDGITPVAGKDYPTIVQMESFAKQLVAAIKVPRPADGRTPQKGLDYFTSEEINIFLSQCTDELKKQSGQMIRDKLSALEGDERLSAKAIKDLPQLVRQHMPPMPIELKSRSSSPTLEVSGYGQDIRKIVFGSNITVARIGDGVISVNAVGSGSSNGVAVETAAETADGIITVFTFVHNPLIVISGNQSFINGNGVTITGTGPYTVTFPADAQPFTNPYILYNS